MVNERQLNGEKHTALFNGNLMGINGAT